MNNENIEKVDEVEVEEADQAEATEGIQEKAVESPEARYSRLKRQTEQAAKKLGLDVEETAPTSKKKASKGLDYGQKAFLIANEIKGSAEQQLAEQLMKETGKELDSLVESSYFKNELSNLREQTATENAIPNGNGKGNQSASDSVDYWLKKGDLPPVSEKKLREDVVNARLSKDKHKGQFYNS